MPAIETPGQARLYAALDERFESAIEACLRGVAAVDLLFSGGVDSSIVALALRERIPFDALAIGVPGSRDLPQAGSAAHILGIPLRTVEITIERARWIETAMTRFVHETPEPVRSVQISLALALQATERSVVITGQGADELFGGYAHFRGLTTRGAGARRASDLRQLTERDWPQTLEIGRALGRELRSPFLDASFLAYASTLPLPPMASGERTKPLLRDWAVHRGVPRAVADRPKLAIQYGTGIARLLRAMPSSALPRSNAGARGPL